MKKKRNIIDLFSEDPIETHPVKAEKPAETAAAPAKPAKKHAIRINLQTKAYSFLAEISSQIILEETFELKPSMPTLARACVELVQRKPKLRDELVAVVGEILQERSTIYSENVAKRNP